MKYFLLRQKNKLIKPVTFSVNPLEKETDDEEPVLLPCKIDEDTSMPDFLNYQNLFTNYLFVSEELYHTFRPYADEIMGKPVILADMKTQYTAVYFKITLEEIDCLLKKENMSYNSFILEQSKLEHKTLFQITYENKKYVIVSLHLAENMLRKNFYGIDFIPVELVEEGTDE